MAGVHPVTFWLSNLLWDFLLFSAVAVVVVAVVVLMDERDLFKTNGAWLTLSLIHFVYGAGAILLAYVFSFATKSAPSSYAFYVLVVLVAGTRKIRYT